MRCNERWSDVTLQCQAVIDSPSSPFSVFIKAYSTSSFCDHSSLRALQPNQQPCRLVLFVDWFCLLSLPLSGWKSCYSKCNICVSMVIASYHVVIPLGFETIASGKVRCHYRRRLGVPSCSDWQVLSVGAPSRFKFQVFSPIRWERGNERAWTIKGKCF